MGIRKRMRERSQVRAIDQRIEALKKRQGELRGEIIEMEGKVRSWGISPHERVMLRQSIIRKESELKKVRGEIVELVKPK